LHCSSARKKHKGCASPFFLPFWQSGTDKPRLETKKAGTNPAFS